MFTEIVHLKMAVSYGIRSVQNDSLLVARPTDGIRKGIRKGIRLSVPAK